MSAAISALAVLVLELVEVHQRHGMHLDVVRHHEFHARQAHPVGRNAPPAEGGRRIGEIEHDVGLGFRRLGEVDLARFELGGALVDEALLAFRAGHRDLLLVVQQLGGVPGADHRRQAKLAADDSRVRGAPAVVGDDGRRPLHDRHPVRVGGLRHQHGAVDEAVDVFRAVDDTDFARHHRVADAQSGHQRAAFRLDAIGAEGGSAVLRLHRFGPRLHDEQFAALAVLGPFHVHGPAVMLLDDHRPARELQDVLVVQHETRALRLRGRHVLGRMRAVGGVDHLLRLLAVASSRRSA